MLKSHHSLHYQGTAKSSSSTKFEIYSKSDIDIALSSSCSNEENQDLNLIPGEYYKRYEHDEVPVKDSNSTGIVAKGSLTNSELEKIETRIYDNISQKLENEDSTSSLESNIKFFKTTVEKVFDNFHASMRDFEVYRLRFQEIIAKNTKSSIEDMEDFIKDMFEHILSSGSCSSENSVAAAEVTYAPETLEPTKTNSSLLDAYVNENYLTDSTLDDDSPKGKSARIEELFHLLIQNDPHVHETLNKRPLLSEINIRKPRERMSASPAASADNLKKWAAKRMEVEIYDRQQNDTLEPDREIPVKPSFAKKDIYLDEDFSSKENNDKSKSILYKICSLICKKFRNK